MLLIAISFFAIGICSLKDWYLLKMGKNSSDALIDGFINQKEYRFLASEKGLRSWLSRFFLGLLVFLAGVFVAFLEVAWPSNIFVSFLLYEMTTPGRELPAIATLCLYEFFFVVPLIVVLWSFCGVLKSDKAIDRIKRNMSIVLIIVAAIFLACGAALFGFI